MKILLLLPLFLPYIAEVWIESHYELKKKISISHEWSMVVRGLVMAIIAVLYHVSNVIYHQHQFQKFGPVFVMQIAIHFAFFNYTYNAITKRPMFYLRDAGFDKLLKDSVNPLAILFFQFMALLVAVVYYFPEINKSITIW